MHTVACQALTQEATQHALRTGQTDAVTSKNRKIGEFRYKLWTFKWTAEVHEALSFRHPRMRFTRPATVESVNGFA